MEMEELEKRLAALEHLVNDVIIGGLKKANDEYIDEDNYGKFKEAYGEMLSPYVEPMKLIVSDDSYDLTRDLYDFAKKQDGYGTEGFDEKSIITDAIENIKSKIAAIKNVDPDNVEVKAEVNVDTDAPDKKEGEEENKEEAEKSDDELAQEFIDAMNK